jgi:serine/threonine protein phosphatase 1
VNKLFFRIEQNFNRTIVVGDIHGCYAELMQLLDKLSFSDNDILIAVGDLVDRGPDSWGVVDFFRETPNAFSVLGNHERRLSGTIRGTSEPAWSQLHTLSKITKQETVYAAYLENYPAVIETDHAIVTHARLDPAKPVDRQDPKFTCAVGGDKTIIETSDEGIPLWFTEWEKVNKVNKPICIGHIGYDRVELVPGKLIALDTGVVRGGMLTAVILPENRIVQIKAEHNYYNLAFSEWTEMFLEDIGNYPIYKYQKLKRKDDLNKFDQKIVSRFEEHLEELKIEQLILEIKDKLIKRFGEVPKRGIDKGTYFKNLGLGLPVVNSRMFNMILNKPFQINFVLSQFQGKSLNGMMEELKKLGEILN